MEPIKFKEQNKTYHGPKNSNIKPLPVYQDEQEIISCWKLGFKERISALIFGKVWLAVMSENQPPIYLEATKTFLTKVATDE